MNITRWKRSTALLLLAAMLGQGCAAPGARLQYLIGEDKVLEHYKDYATAIEYPVETEPNQTDPNLFRAPRTLNSLEEVEQRFVRLDECVRLALANSSIIIDDQSFGSPGNPLLANPSRVASVYDTAIQETSFLFGNRGTEAALSDFDAIYTNSMQLGRSEDVQNFGTGAVLVDQTAQWQARLEKSLANSGTIALQNDWNYSEQNAASLPARLFPSAFTGSVSAEYRQPLLAGSGTEYTRIAGPLAQGVRGVSGVSQGVLISRINTDISLVDFEQSVTTLVRDVEKIYWDLYLALQLYHSEVETFKDIVRFQKQAAARARASDSGENKLRAYDRLYQQDGRIKGSLVDVMVAEQRLRRLLGLPLEDGQFLTPIEKPTEAKLVPEWEASLIESLAHRPELRRQKWEIRSLELQLSAAKNLARPRLDFVSNYRINGFGDHLFGENDDDGQTAEGYNSALESLTQGNNTGWGAGLQLSLPVGLRLARAQVRNYELRLRKARQALQRQESEIGGELLLAIREMERWYELAEVGAIRAENGVQLEGASRKRLEAEGDRNPDALSRVLEAKINSRDADQGYLRSVIEYNKAITDLNFRKGTLLINNSIFLSEGEWNPEAYDDVYRRAEAMTHAIDNPKLETKPGEFVAGPGDNAWESLGSPDRPHIPGVIDSVTSPQSANPNMSVPEVPPETAPEAAEETMPEEAPKPADPPQDFGTTLQNPIHRLNYQRPLR